MVLAEPDCAETIECVSVAGAKTWPKAVVSGPVEDALDVSVRLRIPVTWTFEVDDVVSTRLNTRVGALAKVVNAGTLLIAEVTVNESPDANAKPETVTVPAVVESDAVPVSDPVPLTTVTVNALPAVPENNACEGVELSTPIPNAATATSAMRLKFVVVDIYFLSIVVTRNFLVAASR
jgi:hypothetical protein